MALGLGFGERMMLGGAAGAALSAGFGPSGTPLEDRLKYGAGFGAAAGIAAPLARRTARNSGTRVWAGARAAVNAPVNHVENMFLRFDNLRGAGKSRYEAALHGFGTFPAFIGAGTAIGAMVGGPQGALIGAGVGVVARPVLHAASAYNNQLGKIPLARTFAVTGLSALAAAAWMSRSNPDHVDTGYYDDAGEAQTTPGRVSGRLNTIGASGDMVFGMHRGRHG